MAFQAPLHKQCLSLVQHAHLINATMTDATPETLCDMNRMVKVNKVCQVMDAAPMDRFFIPPALSNRCKRIVVFPDGPVAVHARARGGHSGGRFSFHCIVAVTAIDAQSANMMFMTE